MRGRLLGLLVAAASGAVMLLSVVVMFGRIRAHNATDAGEVFVFQRVLDRAFTFDGRPVEVRDAKDEGGRDVVVVDYGGSTVTLPVLVAGIGELGDLRAHEDWLSVLRFAPATGKSNRGVLEDIEAGRVRDRLVVVTRIPPAGTDPRTWGEVWRKGWSFEFHELLPGGGFASSRLGFPTNRRGQAPKEGELREGTWEFQAAIMVMPRARPSPQFMNDAMSVLGWTLPVSGVSALGVVAGLALAAAPRGRRAGA